MEKDVGQTNKECVRDAILSLQIGLRRMQCLCWAKLGKQTKDNAPTRMAEARGEKSWVLRMVYLVFVIVWV